MVDNDLFEKLFQAVQELADKVTEAERRAAKAEADCEHWQLQFEIERTAARHLKLEIKRLRSRVCDKCGAEIAPGERGKG